MRTAIDIIIALVSFIAGTYFGLVFAAKNAVAILTKVGVKTADNRGRSTRSGSMK